MASTAAAASSATSSACGDGVSLFRLYVLRAAYRGAGLGRLLTETALEAARAMGYVRIRLDTLPQMAAAQRLYESLGFHDIGAYYGEPVPGQRFMEAMLN